MSSDKESNQNIQDIQDIPAEDIAVHTETFNISKIATGEDLPANYYKNWRFVGVIAACVLCNNAQIGPYVLSANSIPYIEADLEETSNAIWISLAYILCMSVSMLISGRLTDIFGRRWFVIGANALSCLGCIVASTANSINTIIGGTVLIGLGAAIQINFPILISELVPKSLRPIYVGVIYSTSIAFFGFGAYLSYAFSHNNPAGWRWSYRVGIILSGVSALAFWACYHPPKFELLHVNRSKLDQVKRQDFVGLFLFTAGLVLFVLGVSWGGSLYPWKSAQVIATLVIGVCTLIVFGLYEIRLSRSKNIDQLLPTHLFKAHGYISMVILASVGTVVAYSGQVFWPREVNAIIQGTPTRLALLSSVLGCACLAGFFLGGILFRFCSWHRTILIGACMILVAFCGAMSSVQPGDDKKGPALVAFVMLPVGVLEVGARALLPLTCPDEDIGAALGAMGSIGYAIASVGLAVYSAVLTNKVKSVVFPKIVKAALEAGLPKSSIAELVVGYPSKLASVPGMNSKILAAVAVAGPQGYADAFRYVWYCALAFAIAALAASCFTVNYNEYLTDTVARRLQYGSKEKHSGADDA